MTNTTPPIPSGRRYRRPPAHPRPRSPFGPSFGRPRGLPIALAAPWLAVGLLGACGSDDPAPVAADAPATTPAAPPSSPATTTPPPAETGPTTSPAGTAPATSAPAPSTAAVTTAHEHEQPIVRVGLVDYAFGGLPASVPAGTQLSVTNTSDTELHELLAFRLPDEERRPVDELLQLPPAEFESIVGHPVTVLLAPPGEDGFAALGDGTLAEPGRYVILCAIPVGADPDEYLAAAAAAAETGEPPQVAGGPPHFTQGMVAELSVEP